MPKTCPEGPTFVAVRARKTSAAERELVETSMAYKEISAIVNSYPVRSEVKGHMAQTDDTAD